MVSAVSQSVPVSPSFTSSRVSKSRSVNPKNRVEIFFTSGPICVEPLTLSPETASGYYDDNLRHAPDALLTAQELVFVIDTYYYDQRWYDAPTGQFMSPDPILEDKENPYRGMKNSPTNYTDPDGQSVVGKIFKKTAKETGYAIMKRRLKTQISKKLVQIHHIIPQTVFTKGPHAKWLKKLEVDKDAFANVTPLPTVKGIMKGAGKKRAIHDGGHLRKYFDDVNSALDDIMAKNMAKKNPLSDDQAKAAIRTLQDKIRKDLKEGAIELHNEADLLKKYGTGAALFFIGMTATEQEAYAEEMAEKEAQKFEEALERENLFTLGRATTYTGNEDDAAGWFGFSVDMINPLDDFALIGDGLNALDYYIGDDDKPFTPSPPEPRKDGWGTVHNYTPQKDIYGNKGRVWRLKGGGAIPE